MALLTQDYPPAPGGMNVAQAAQEIDDTEARYLQDILLDYAGIARRRGPVQPLSTVAALPRPATNFASTIDPAGTTRFAALTGNAGAGYLTVWNTALSATSDIPWAFPLPTDPVGSAATAYRLSSVTPALNGGSFIGTASDYGTSVGGAQQALALWRGGVNTDYNTGTLSLTRGSTAVAGGGTAWTANLSPGMFLFATVVDALAGSFTLTYIGTIYSVTNNTNLVLEKPSPYTTAPGSAYLATSLRGTTPKVVKGRITCDTASTTVSGGNTKFASQGMGTGTWNLYRQRDFAFIGKVSTVPSDIAVTLAANALIAMADELYVAIRGDWSAADKSTDNSGAVSKLGWLTAVYAERQWYAANNTSFDKTYRLWFSDTGDVEAVDISDDGDWIPIASTTDAPEAIRALVPTYNALLVLKDTESFAVYGSSPDSFSAKKLEDDGTLSTMSVQSYGGGAIWAGRNGIYFYDGVQNTNMTLGKFGPVWENTIRTFDPTRYRMWSMMVRNHYFLHIERITPTIQTVKGNTGTTPNHWTVCLNMETRAFTLLKNVGIRGAVQLPASAGRGMWYLVNSGDNILTNPSVEADLTNWQLWNPGVARSSVARVAGGVSGNWQALVTATTTSDFWMTYSGSTSGSGPAVVPVTPGQRYTFSAYVKRGVGSSNVDMEMDWFKTTTPGDYATGAVSFSQTSVTQPINAAGYTRISMTAVAPLDAHYVMLWIGSPSSIPVTIGDSFYVDAMQLNTGYIKPYAQSYVCDSTDLFDTEGVDTLNTSQAGGVQRTNIVSNPSAETNLTGVTLHEATTVTRDTTHALYGSYAFKTLPGNSYMQGVPSARWQYSYWDTLENIQGPSAGRTFAASMWVYFPAGTYYIDLYMHEYGGAQPHAAILDTADTVTYTTDGWRRLTGTGTVVQNDRNQIQLGLYLEHLSDVAVPYWIDGRMIEETSTIGDYFDGSTLPSASWNGTAHASPSTLNSYGPDFYYETKKFNAGEDIRLKRIRQLAAHYLAQGGNIKVDTVLGLNDVGSTLTGTLPASVYTWDTLRLAFAHWSNLSTQYGTWAAITQGVFRPKKIGFMKKGHHIAFRYYQSNPDMVRVRLGPQQIGYKPMRPSRV